MKRQDLWDLGKVTSFAEDQPFSQVIVDICGQLGLSVVCPDGIGKVSAAFDDADGERSIRELCRAVGLFPHLEGKVLVLGKPMGRADTFGVWYRGQDDASTMIEVGKAVLGKEAEIKAVGERVVVAGSQEDVERMSDVVAHLEAAGADTWLLDVTLVSLDRSVRRDAGLDWSFTGGAGAGLDASVGSSAVAGPVFGARAQAAVAVVAKALEEGHDASTLTRGTLMVIEGQTAQLHQGQSVPLPKRTISDQGVVTITGYDNIHTGFELSVEAHRVDPGVSLKVSPRLSGVVGFQGEQPIIAERQVESTVQVSSGEWLVISGFEEVSDSFDFAGIPGLPDRRLFHSDRTLLEGRSLVVLLRATRVRAGGS